MSGLREWRWILAAVVLVAFALSGLAAGTLAGTLARGAGARVLGTVTGGPGSPSAATGGATPTSTTVPTVIPAPGFSFFAVATPSAVQPGDHFTVELTAVDNNKRPLVGLSCVMGPPSHGRPTLFQQWPGAQVTDAQGHASWSLVAPQVAPGYYVMAITASGQHDSGYLWEPGITIQG
jgi:hypothetical protein